MIRYFHLSLLCLIHLLVVTGCDNNYTPDVDTNDNDVMIPTKVPVPDEFIRMVNPLGDTAQVVEQGEIIYQVNCASCHGVAGRGDGVAASPLEKKPNNLAKDQKDLSDAYLYWRIYAGGAFEPFRSMMPGWRSLLTEDDIWKIISYLRTLEG